MIPISIFLALVSTMPLTGSSAGTAQTATDTIVCPADSIPVKIMAKAASDNSFSPVFTLDEVTALPSPDVAAMTRHIDEGIDYSTGTGGLSIPLYSWSAGDLKMSLGLRYRLGAYKVKERAGWVGLGWNLTGGGCVTREIVGLPDEKNNTSIRPVNQISTDENGHLYLQDIEEFKEDSDLDRYRYSCPGAEGSFVIKSGKIVQTPETDNIIEFTGTIRDGVRDFVVTTPDGTKYYFTEREKLSFRMETSRVTLPMKEFLYYQNAVSAWHLSKIESPGGSDVATYSYATLPSWQKTDSIWGNSVTVTWSESLEAGYPKVNSSTPGALMSKTHTTFSGQKLLKGIATRTARIEFIAKTESTSYAKDTLGVLSGIRVLNPDGECVRDISFRMSWPKGSSHMLEGLEMRSDGELLDSHDFSYVGNKGKGQDFFGYCNASSEKRAVIDSETGRMSSAIAPDSTRMPSRAMWRHRTGMGLTTIYEYEPSSVKQSGNGKEYDFAIGLRIRKITSKDTVTGRTRIREFTYSSPVCDVDFTKLSVSSFTGLTGDYMYVQKTGVMGVSEYYSTCLSFYSSSKLKGFRPEDATVYYGVVEENESGTGIDVPVKTRYEYDLSRCGRPFVPAISPNLGNNDKRALTYASRFGSSAPQLFMNIISTGARIPGSFMEGVGFEPRLIKKIEYEHSGKDYRPRITEDYHYVTVDSSSLITGVYLESAVRNVVDVYSMRHKDYTSTGQFSYGNNVMSCSGSLLDSVFTTKHFLNGDKRQSSVRYLYSGPTRMPLIKPRASKVIVDFITPGMLNAFGIDTISVGGGARTCYGIRRREGGHVMEHYTAVSGMFSTPFFSKVKDVGQKTLPVREIWVVDGTDTITRTWEYGLFNGAYRPTLIRLAGKGDTEMDFQRIKGYTAYGHPTAVLRKGKPEVSYKWGYGGDLMTESTESGGGISLSTTYTHTPLVGCTSIKTPDGSVTQYNYRGGRLVAVLNGDSIVIKRHYYSLCGVGELKLNTMTVHYNLRDAGRPFLDQHGLSTTVYDGFGLPVAERLEDFGSDGDVAEITQYDGLHRPVRIWQPLPTSTLSRFIISPNLLSVKASELYKGDSRAFSELKYPESKEERPVSQTIPGNDFKNHPDKTVFTCTHPIDAKSLIQRFSLKGDLVQCTGFYFPGELDCEVRKDGNGNELLIFTDALGRTVLERRSATGGKYADTYTISDSWGNPLVVLPPMASSLIGKATGSWKLTDTPIKDYAFIYTYDNALRLRSRVDAGVRKTEFAYDRDGRLAFSRESGKNVRFHTYDPVGREAVSGTCVPEGKEQLWTSDMSEQTPPMTMTRTGKKGTGFLGTGYTGTCIEAHAGDSLLYANYYDDHSFKPASWNPIDAEPPAKAVASPKGLLTGRLLSALTSEGRWNTLTVIYYKKDGIPIRTESDGPVAYNSENITPSIAGLPLIVDKTVRMGGKKYNYSVKYSYDLLGRLIKAVLTGDGIPEEGKLLTEVSFDRVGNPSTFKSEGNYMRSITRDIRGRVSSWSCPFMSQKLGYGDSGNNPDWTGRITWRKTTVGGIDRRYDYTYSPEGFLTSAVYSSEARPGDNFSATYSYDLNGNVLSASRKSPDAVGRSAMVSETMATYDGNRLVRMSGDDDASAPSESRMRKNGINSNGVTYDGNGNLDFDATRDISRIIYNDIGRPELIETDMGGDQIHIGYLADGRKFRELYLSGDGMSDKERSMVNGFEFSDGKFVRFETPFGYIDSSNVLHTYIPDAQGNIVGVINTSNGTLEQFTDFYPYGMPHTDAIGAEKNRRKFVSKELTTEFGVDVYDFEQRMLGLLVPMFHSPDPLAYMTPYVSPYSYCYGDPVNYSDPTGLYVNYEDAMYDSFFKYPGSSIIWNPRRMEWYLEFYDNTAENNEFVCQVRRIYGDRGGSGRGGIGGGGGGGYTSNVPVNMQRVATGISGFSVATGAQEHLIVWGVRSGVLKNVPGADKLTDTQAVTKGMGKTVGNYYKVVKGVGFVSAFATAAASGMAMYEYNRRGGRNWTVYAKGVLDIAMAGVGCIGLPGYLISTGYFILDTASGGLFGTPEPLPEINCDN